MAKANKIKRKKITLQFEGDVNADVFVVGSFNDWSVEDKKKAKKMKAVQEKEGAFEITMMLPLGEYEYKFYSEGKWFVDPRAEEAKPNGLGSYNSVLKVA